MRLIFLSSFWFSFFLLFSLLSLFFLVSHVYLLFSFGFSSVLWVPFGLDVERENGWGFGLVWVCLFPFACSRSEYSDSDLSTQNSIPLTFSNHFHPPLTFRFRNLPIFSTQIPVSQTFFKSLSPTPHFPIPQPTDFPSYPRDSILYPCCSILCKRGMAWLVGSRYLFPFPKTAPKYSNSNLSTQTTI